MITNIKIITSDGRQIDYEKETDLSIKMNRVADDLQDIEARYGEFSYSFSLPMTRNNSEIFGFAGVPHVKRIFKVNPVEVKVFNNDMLILSGQLELQEIDDDKYKCIFYSKLTQLTDALADKNMQDLTVCPKIVWNYEDTIRGHIATGGTNSDETSYQFPLIFYNTFFTPTSVFSGLTDTVVDSNGTTNHIFQRERDAQNWYYMINHTSLGENEVYQHQIPLAFFLKSMMEYMLEEVGWTMGGSFWEDANIKRIIVPYIGDTDVYDRAIYCSSGGWISGNTCMSGYTYLTIGATAGADGGVIMLDTAKFMPDMGCLDFLENIVNLFNLYLMIDVNQKTIIFETYDVMFGSKIAPYEIDNKIIGDIVISRVEDYNPSIRFSDVTNKRILGDNRYIASSGTNAYNLFTEYRAAASDSLFDEVFNYAGTTAGNIKLDFAVPTVKTMRIRNDYDYNDVNRSAGDTVMFLPFSSKQLPEDNAGKNFSKKDTDTIVYNSEETIAYNYSKPALYYYYGISNSDFKQHTDLINKQSLYFYFNFDDTNQKIPFCSPFALTSYRDNINAKLEEAKLNPTGATTDAGVMLASYMQSIYLMMASSTGVSNTTDFSLILADNNEFGDTIYTRFHANKYKRYAESEVLEADIRITDYDWNNLQINQPVEYNKDIYSILSIENYDIVKGTATIRLIKQL